MSLSLRDLQAEAAAAGFLPEAPDKVVRLIGLPDAFRNHSFLGDRVALKGGTALDLFVSDLLRLSVDIDLNYIGFAELWRFPRAGSLEIGNYSAMISRVCSSSASASAN